MMKKAKKTKNPDHTHVKLPVGTLISDPIKGEFLSLPMFGWVGVRAKTRTPLVMLTLLLFESVEEPTPKGTLQVELPVLKDTELAVLAALDRYGWDGRIWPEDAGWPHPGSEEEANIKYWLEQAEVLKNTLTFPPSEKGRAVQKVLVNKATGPFLMPPLMEPKGAVDTVKLNKLRKLCAEPSIFYRT